MKFAGLGAVFMFLFTGSIYAQSLGYYTGSDCTFNTLYEVERNCTSRNYLTVQYNLDKGNYQEGWTLQIQANEDFSNGSNKIPAEYISFALGSINGGPRDIDGTGYQKLNKSKPASLFESSESLKTPPHYYFEHKLNMRVSGGNHLTMGTGTYRASITLTLLDKKGKTIAINPNVWISFVVNFSNSCQGANLNTYSSNQYSFTTYAEQMAGATVTDAVSVQYTPNTAACTGWSLKVRAGSNFSNGIMSVPAQFFSLRFNRVNYGSPSALAIGVDNTPLMLNNTDVTLINQSNAPFTAYTGTEHKFDMLIQGGAHLLLANGTYTGNLIFTLYNQDNELVSTSTVSISFAVNSSSNSYTLELQNSANEIDLVFNTLESYATGVSVSKSRGLKVTGYNPYQVMIKTSSSNLAGSDNNSIPVSAVNVETTKYSSTSGGISTYTRALSTADQIIITNPLTDYTQQSVEYNLRYYTTPNDSRLSSKTGVFSTTVLFVVIPQ